MSRFPSRALLRGAAVAATGMLSALAAAAPAHAALSIDQERRCTVPLIGAQTVTFTTSVTELPSVSAGGQTSSAPLTVKFQLPPSLVDAFDIAGAEAVDGTGAISGGISLDDAATPVQLPINFPRRAITSGFTTELSGTATWPALQLPGGGNPQLDIDEIRVSLRLLDGLDQPITPATLPGGRLEMVCSLVGGPRSIDDGGLEVVRAPTTVTAQATGTSTATVRWTAPVQELPAGTTYEVYGGGASGGYPYPALLATVPATQTSADLDGLAGGGNYTFQVRTKLPSGTTSQFASASPVKLPAANRRWPLTFTGNATMPTLARGEVALTGAMDLSYTGATGAVGGTISFNRTRIRLASSGLIPLTAWLEIVPSGEVTGQYVYDPLSPAFGNGRMSMSAAVKLRLPQVYLFGSIPLPATRSCQSRQYTKLSLSSGIGVPYFPTSAAQYLSGYTKISDFTGCGALNGLLNPSLSGTDNSITLATSPAAPAAPAAS